MDHSTGDWPAHESVTPVARTLGWFWSFSNYYEDYESRDDYKYFGKSLFILLIVHMTNLIGASK